MSIEIKLDVISYHPIHGELVAAKQFAAAVDAVIAGERIAAMQEMLCELDFHEAGRSFLVSDAHAHIEAEEKNLRGKK